MTEKVQQAMASTLERSALIIVQSAFSLNNFLNYSIPQKLVVASKVTNLAMYSMIFFACSLLHLQAVFRVTGKNATVDVGYNYTTSS